MLTTLAALLLTLTPEALPAAEAPPVGITRSASLLAQETVTLERRVKSLHLLPVWVPLVAGVGGGALAAGLGVLALTTLSGATLATFGQGFAGLVLVLAGPVFAVAGIVVAIVFGVKNAARQEQLDEAQRDLARTRDELAKAREAERTQSLLTPWREGLDRAPATLTVATF